MQIAYRENKNYRLVAVDVCDRCANRETLIFITFVKCSRYICINTKLTSPGMYADMYIPDMYMEHLAVHRSYLALGD